MFTHPVSWKNIFVFLFYLNLPSQFHQTLLTSQTRNINNLFQPDLHAHEVLIICIVDAPKLHLALFVGKIHSQKCYQRVKGRISHHGNQQVKR